jgi:hypothetical protein
VLQIIEPIMHGLHWPDAVPSYVVEKRDETVSAVTKAIGPP